MFLTQLAIVEPEADAGVFDSWLIYLRNAKSTIIIID